PITVSLAIVARPQLKQLWTDVVLWFSSNTQMTIPLAAFEVQKIGHFLVFFLITLLMLRGRHLLRLGVIESCAIVLSLGLFTEALQNHSFTRNPSLTDVGIDASGILLAMLTWRLTSATHKRQPRTP
nr:VanZ family protein [Gammaproteobacteria bacterium]